MRFRKLRIAWSATWALIALLLTVSWVRSYQHRTTAQVLVTPSYRYYVHSLRGTVALKREFRSFLGFELMRIHQESDYLSLITNAGIKIEGGPHENYFSISISYWLLCAAAAGLSTISWLPWRFSLRALLIATTLVAALLGLIAWSTR